MSNNSVQQLARALAIALLTALSAQAQSSKRKSPNTPTAYHQRFADIVSAKGKTSDRERLRRLFALDWEYSNVTYPEQATYVGYPGQNARWTDRSVTAIAERKKALQDPLAVIKSINRAKLDSADRLNYDLFRKNAEDAIAASRFPSEYLAIGPLSGPQGLAEIIALQPQRTVRDYEAIIARLDSLPAVIDATIVLLQKGLQSGVTQPQVILRDVPGQVKDLIPDSAWASALLAPFNNFSPDVPANDRPRLRDRALTAYNYRTRPAYQRLYTFLTDSYIPKARTSVGMSELPDGSAWYALNVKLQTTTNRTPEEIHQLGLSEVKRIRAQMDSLIASTGFKGSFEDFTKFLRTDPKFYFTDSASLVEAYRDVTKRIDPGLIKLFGRLPRLPYGVITIPSYAAKSQTTAYYQPGSLEAGRPGWYYVNTYALDQRPTWEMEALSLHESVPGHHLQIALAQEISGIPEFRRFGSYTAFVEGWGLYAESLGPELGMYKDPYSKFGQLTYEMWRAIRLVVDTGIHSMGWSRDSAIAFFKANSAKTEHDITVEIDRYIGDPGQALAYKSGELEIKALKAYARQELGDRFDIRAFHDEVLGQGALPLDILEKRVKAWVEARRATKA
jgi:uncharacterized protein (DUF885 family)